jgi:hypothetical protein
MDISWKQVMLGVVAIGMTAAVIRPSAFEEHPTGRSRQHRPRLRPR